MYRKNAWKKYDATLEKEVMNFAEGYKEFLSASKTERLAVKEAVKRLEAKGFKNIDALKKVTPGDKVYFINRNKNVCAFVIGEKKIAEGLRILGAHIDSPRMDLKEHPFYEKNEFALADTHYYGGIKKYQWVTIPLALHGVICLKNGKTVELHVGEDENDPVVGISDLLIHLSADQLTKPAAKVIEGENLDVTIGNRPLEGEEKNATKAYILKLLKDKHGVGHLVIHAVHGVRRHDPPRVVNRLGELPDALGNAEGGNAAGALGLPCPHQPGDQSPAARSRDVRDRDADIKDRQDQRRAGHHIGIVGSSYIEGVRHVVDQHDQLRDHCGHSHSRKGFGNRHLFKEITVFFFLQMYL